MRKIWLSGFFVLASAVFFSAVEAATFTVNTTGFTNDANTGDNICADAGGSCSFRAAIQQANALEGADSIVFDAEVFSAPQTLATNSSYPAITQDLMIAGTSPANVIIDGTGNARLVSVDSDVTVTLSNLTVTGGYIGESSGGCIANSGDLTLDNITVTNCEAILGNGAGVFTTNGTLTINNSRIVGNSTMFFGSGAGISSTNSTVSINDSTVSGNNAANDGGGIFVSGGTLTLTRSTVGGEIAAENGNTAFDGGGIYNLNATINLNNSTVSGNIAKNIGGGYYGFAGVGTAILNIDASTIAFNSAASGGGVAAAVLATKITSSVGFDSTVNLSNTIISDNTATTGADVSDDPDPDNFSGTIVSNGYNIIFNPAGATITPNVGDKFGVDPLLAPLANNGGPTLTHALLPRSPAIDAGNTTLSTDQRGQARPVNLPNFPPAPGGNNSDIGAFEVLSAVAASVSVSGRVLTADGRGVSRINLSLTESDGTVHSAATNQFGYYSFEELLPGQTVIVRAVRKGFQFPSQIVTVNEDVRELNFVVETIGLRK